MLSSKMLSLALFILSPLFTLSVSTLANGLTTIDFDLAHRDSPLSPFYNSSRTLSDLAENINLRSSIRRRLNLILQTDILPPVIIESAEGGDIIMLGEYLVKIHVGSPPVETWLIADTGSDLIWLQCLPCDTCYPQNTPIFNPSKSSTYTILSCHSKSCSFLPKGYYGCGKSKQCMYGYGYSVAKTFGELGRDVFGFGVGGKSDSFQRSLLVFGCGHNNSGEFSRKGSGIMGLGAGNLSLVSQLGSKIGYKFSYCLVPYFSNSTGKLKLGIEEEKGKMSGSDRAVSSSVTPFKTGGFTNSNYMLTLEGVTVGNKRVETGRRRREGNTVIDSGGTWFLMESRFYNKVEALMKESIGLEPVKNASDFFNLCYSNKHYESVMKNFPDFVVHFKGGADVYLKPHHNIFFPQDHLVCLAILPADDGSGFDYGNIPQVNFQVEYDLQAKQISFAPAHCGKH